MTNKKSTTDRSIERWIETKHEYDVANGIQVLKHVTKEKKSFDWYNSSIFLWFLGALFLTFIPWGWSVYKSRQEQTEKIEKLDNEVSGRFNQLFSLAQRYSDSIKDNPKIKSVIPKCDDTAINVRNLFFKFTTAPKETQGRMKFYPSYMEFDDYPISTLLNQLVPLIKNPEKQHVKDVIAKIISPKYIKPTTSHFIDAVIVDSIRENLYLKRWQK